MKYHAEGGIADFVRHINSPKGEPVHPDVIDFEGEDKDRTLAAEIALQWNSQYSECVYTFANNINTHGGGTHEEGFRSALTTLINQYAQATRSCSRRRTTTSPARTSARA